MATTTANKATIVRKQAATSGSRTASITVNFSLQNGQPVFTFDPQSVEMAYGTDTLTFTLVTSTGFFFDSYFAPQSADGTTFSWSLDSSKMVLTVTDVNHHQGEPISIKYSIAVKNTSGTRYVSDPEIINDPETN